MSDGNCPCEVVDHSEVPSGGRILETDPRTIMLHRIVRDERPDVPATHDWRPLVHEELERENLKKICEAGCSHHHYQWGLMLNSNRIPDCTVAAAGHMIQTWTANADGHEFTIPDQQVKEAYCRLTGISEKDFDSATQTHPGSSCLKALKFWRKSGVGDHRIHAFVGLRAGNRDDVQEAIYTFGSAYVCLLLPATAIHQTIWKAVDAYTDAAEKWFSSGRNSWEAHAVCAVAYDEEGLTVITWGFEKRMTWEFYEKYSDEAYGVLSKDWIAADGKAPNHIDADALDARLDALSVWGTLRALQTETGDRSQLETTLKQFPGGPERVAEIMPFLLELSTDEHDERMLLAFIHEIGFDRWDVREQMERYLHRREQS